MSRTALIVDDNEDIRLLLRTIIENEHDPVDDRWSVVGEAGHGPAALEVWRATQPDVVILDQRMPGMSGLELAERMLTEDPRQPIVLFSAYLSQGVRTRAEALGLCAILSKDEYSRIPEILRECVTGSRQADAV